ncbi:uncharacterized protein LOC130743634 [Lotus japonicus]|uniref:uncharacterized protein LOC130735974 n=1 Tax=Lotus japonicus TaxID=34305 RepID=UPI00258614D0|nr:uncharacterized protein LOC130735974 [Lotus japonicus]XP_057451852.1 uncharacterized protein LOC130743634 [Lotus japonicus]
MNGSSASSCRSRHRSAGGRAKCQCGVPLMLYTAGTRENSERRFLRCKNWQLPGTCDFFFWIDDPLEGREPVIPHVDAETMSSEIGNSSNHNSVHHVPDLMKKMKKLKKKLEVERFQKNVASVIALMCFLVTVWCLCKGRV